MDVTRFNYLLNKIKSSSTALAEIYDYYYPRIILFINIKYPKETAEDIAQEFFLNLLKAKSFKYIKNPTSWIYKSCENLIIKKLNKNEIAIDEEVLENIKSEENFVDDISKRYDVETALRFEQDKTTKSILYLYFWLGYNLREISELLDMKKSTVKQRYLRSLKKMKNNMN